MSIQISPDDRFEIEDLMARYAWGLDTGDIDAFVACFAADGVMAEEVFGETTEWQGAQAIRRLAESYMEIPGFAGRQHHSANLLVSGLGDGRATARSFTFVTQCQPEPPHPLRFCGWYEDELLKAHDGRWQFARRMLRAWDGEVLQRFPAAAARDEWPRQAPHLRLVDPA